VSESLRKAEGKIRLIKEPIGTETLPIAVAMARSLSPNHAEATLLGMFIRKG
jgi:hypothetical protein